MPCEVDVEEDVDVYVDADFEELEGHFLQITGTYIFSFTDQLIVSKIYTYMKFRKTWLNWHIFIIGGIIWWLYCVVAFRYDDDDLVPIRMYVIFFLVFYCQ